MPLHIHTLTLTRLPVCLPCPLTELISGVPALSLSFLLKSEDTWQVPLKCTSPRFPFSAKRPLNFERGQVRAFFPCIIYHRAWEQTARHRKNGLAWLDQNGTYLAPPCISIMFCFSSKSTGSRVPSFLRSNGIIPEK